MTTEGVEEIAGGAEAKAGTGASADSWDFLEDNWRGGEKQGEGCLRMDNLNLQLTASPVASLLLADSSEAGSKFIDGAEGGCSSARI